MSLKIIKCSPEAYARICEVVAGEPAFEINPIELIVIEKVRDNDGRKDAKPEVKGNRGGGIIPDVTGSNPDHQVDDYFTEG